MFELKWGDPPKSKVLKTIAANAVANLDPFPSGAFYLLSTEPTTPPDQIVQWTRRAKIRSENRLHVVKVEDLETPNVSHLLSRVCFALAGDEKRCSIIDAYSVGE